MFKPPRTQNQLSSQQQLLLPQHQPLPLLLPHNQPSHHYMPSYQHSHTSHHCQPRSNQLSYQLPHHTSHYCQPIIATSAATPAQPKISCHASPATTASQASHHCQPSHQLFHKLPHQPSIHCQPSQQPAVTSMATSAKLPLPAQQAPNCHTFCYSHTSHC